MTFFRDVLGLSYSRWPCGGLFDVAIGFVLLGVEDNCVAPRLMFAPGQERLHVVVSTRMHDTICVYGVRVCSDVNFFFF